MGAVDQDTSPEQIERYHELLRAMTPAQKAAATDALCDAVREGALAGLRHRHPGASDGELRARLFVRLYGRGLATRVLGKVPDDAV
ncbi:MAG: hypothetical protein QM765_36745 [Myxococcales bacterium]